MLGYSPHGVPPIGCLEPEPSYLTAGAAEDALVLTGLLSDEATITTTATVLMPLANLQTKDPTAKCRISGRTGSFLFTFPQPTVCNAFAWVGHNHSPGGVFRVLAGDAASGNQVSSPSVDTNYHTVWPIGVKPSDANWAKHISILTFDNELPFTYYEVETGDDSAEFSYSQFGRAMLGYGLRLRIDAGYRSGITNADFRRRSSRNKIVTGRNLPGRTMRLPFAGIDESDAMSLQDLGRRLGTALDLVVSRNPAETTYFHRNTIHGVLMETGEIEALSAWGPNGQQWSASLPVEEL